jgi:hypothetical protein
MLAIADVAEVTAVLDRRFVLELGVPQFVLNVPMRVPVTGRVKEGALQRRHRPVDGTLAPARDTGESVFGGTAEGDAIQAVITDQRDAKSARQNRDR